MAMAVIMVVLNACAASREQADEALKAAEGAITAQHADAMRFAPESFAAVMDADRAARAAYEKEDWATAIAVAESTATQARRMAPAIAAGKEQAAARWPMVRDSVQAMLAALGERLAEVQRTRRYPDGMTAADVQLARTQVDSLSAGLDKARAAFDRGEVADAMHAAERVRMEAGAMMGAVGLRPGEPARGVRRCAGATGNRRHPLRLGQPRSVAPLGSTYPLVKQALRSRRAPRRSRWRSPRLPSSTRFAGGVGGREKRRGGWVDFALW
jgi:hypothetical protein